MTIAMVAGAPPLALAGPASRLRTINAALASLGAAVMNSAPQGTDKTITTWEDMRYTFTRADFGFSDVDGDVLQAVRIASLPTAGVLTTAGRVMLAGDLVSAADIDALQLVFTPAANANGAGYASFTFQVQDDGGTAGGGADFDPSANTITVDVIATNDAPTGTNTTITTGEDTAHTFTRADFGFGDIDGDSLQAVRVTTLPVAGVLTLGGVAISAGDAVSAMDIDASRLAFAPPADANGAGFARIDFRVEDTGGTANGGSDVDATANTVTVDVTPVNDAPMGLDRTITANEDASYTFTSADFAFSDVEGDSLQAVRIATLPWVGMLTLDGVGVAAGELVSASAIDAFQLTFTPAANGHGAGYANFAFQVQDAGGTADGGANLDASASTITVDVTSISDAPAGTDRTVSTSEGTAYVFTRADFVFSDVDGDALQAVRITTLPWPGILTVGGMEVNAGDMVFAPDIDAGGLVYTPGSAAGRADYASFTFQVMDDGSTAGGGADIDPSANTMTVRITAVNDAPVVTTSGGTTVFTENGSPLVVDGGLTVDDVDNATLASATVMVAGNFRSGQDVLAFTNDGSTMGNIAASYNASTGILTLVSAGSTATLAQWQAALRSVSYA
ncbi:MAG TPA: Ig-like domain-containing protein, partial [Rhodanobacteraceae bacterium]|nr:Ig-like domain-containing protein [Rhodanobacteraceae bacterium]